MAGRVKDVVSRGVRNVSDVMEHPLIEIAVAYTALLSVVIVLVELFMPLTPEARIRLYLVDLAIVMVLTVDFLYRAHKSGDPIGYIKRNAYEIPALIPAGLIAMIEYHLIGFGFVRLIRLVRVVRLALLLTRGSRLVKILKQTENRVDFIGLLGAVSLTIMFGALAVYIAESPYPESPIKDLWTAFWWAVVTSTTVGYGDVVPVTPLGKAIGVLMMILGISALSIVIGTLGTIFLQAAQPNGNGKEDRIIEDICREVKRLDGMSEEELEYLVGKLRSAWHTKKRYSASTA